MNEMLAACFEHNRWANMRLAEACIAAGSVALGASSEVGYGAILPTMRHIALSEQAYLLRLRGAPIDRSPAALREHAGMAEIRDWLAETGAALVEAARQAVAGSTVVMAGDGPEQDRRRPCELFFVQALDHGREHRTQVAAALTVQGIVPPDMDGWTFYSRG